MKTTRGVLWAGAVCVAVGGGLLTGGIAGQAPSQPPAASDEFQSAVQPVLAKNCLTCHSDKMHSGNLSLEAFTDAAHATQKPEVWQKVLDKVTAGQMPPRPRSPLSTTELADLTNWIHKVPGVSAVATNASAAEPGRVTARRLNRTEYNNTVRDLLGVTLRPADEFPLDDSGYGFDNIGDVLSLSPLLMDKYINAARNVARAAVFGEVYPEQPGQLVSLQPKKLQDDAPARGIETPYALRGSLFASYHFPVEAEYEFRWRYGNYRGRGKPVGPGRPFATAADAPAVPEPSADAIAPAPAAGRAAGAGAGRGAAAGAAGAAAGGGGGAAVPRQAPTDEDRKAREEQARKAYAPLLMVLSIDGKQVATDYVEGDGNYNYSHGDNIARVKVPAGDHELRVSWPELADHPNPFRLLNADGRQELFVDYMKILGPYSVSPAPPPSFKKIFICGEPGKYTSPCIRQIVTNLVTRAYRRPGTPEEVDRLVAIVEQVRKRDTVEDGVRLAIEYVLVSPNFLFRIERDPAAAPDGASAGKPAAAATSGKPNPAAAAAAKAGVPLSVKADSNPPAAAATTIYPVSDYELASRLSYFLWSSMPDDELFKAASETRLHDPAVVNAQVQRMLQDPKSNSLVDSFGQQWLNLYLMDRTKPDSDKYLQVDDELLQAMRKETLLFVGAVIHENRSILDFIDGRFTYVNGPLARYYGIKGVKGEQFQRVELNGGERSGIVTQGSILKISSYATRTSPVLRGKWVLDTLLGQAPPPPPSGIPPLEEKDLGTTASMRERLEQHRANPTCAVCHNMMDPIGFSLEHFDAAGAWREKDGNFPVDATGTLPDGRTIDGANGLKKILRADAPIFARNFTEKLMTYALGRGLERTDKPVVDDITKQASADDYRFATILTGIVNSRPFLMRSRAGDIQ
jgi:Protein of unknown function (DUF1592)/Protein of unknown function (DUF1588)/Protein of unknown function (DUF1587)/Protein of unknown function (DUF1585)/Protein of unknown function (DUF1595)/Planctomycete cytochrome C